MSGHYGRLPSGLRFASNDARLRDPYRQTSRRLAQDLHQPEPQKQPTSLWDRQAIARTSPFSSLDVVAKPTRGFRQDLRVDCWHLLRAGTYRLLPSRNSPTEDSAK